MNLPLLPGVLGGHQNSPVPAIWLTWCPDDCDCVAQLRDYWDEDRASETGQSLPQNPSCIVRSFHAQDEVLGVVAVLFTCQLRHSEGPINLERRTDELKLIS